MLGTATYFSPEQAQGFALDGRSDVYALGVVLYEMLTGVAPFTATSPVSIAYKHVRETPAPPSTLVPELAGAMDRIVLTAMAKKVEERYQSAQDLRADLLRFERGRPLAGSPDTAAPASVHVAAPAEATAVAAAAAPASSRTRGRWGPAVVIGIALALLVGLIVVLLANSDFGKEGPSVTKLDVPRAVGVPYGQAAAALESVGFTVARKDVDEPQQAPDVVLSQDPETGRKIPKGGLITLTVSSPTIAMPDVVGQPKAQATQTLAAKYLAPNFVEEDSDQPPGTVLRSDPAAGAPVAKLQTGGRPTVTVVIAREPLVAVPGVAGQDPFTAAATLSGAGFQVSVATAPSDTVGKGGVIGTYPPEGTMLPRGTAITVLVSSGPNTVAMPSVVGMPRAAAEALLNQTLGLGVQVSLVNAGPTKKGLVVSQAPAAGTQVAKGSTVAISVGT